jgi:hypothetical protein
VLPVVNVELLLHGFVFEELTFACSTLVEAKRFPGNRVSHF